ncbi:hypothetical protein DVV91_16695 [Clostridium botulinum]|uniref:hypothetical protein n=1 Tax=Clostridium botulinum TaxID=1491 RepID=UPI0019689162|nr:hypothetical protein [Clostridium botulinum]MBN1075961.1 hypothetical protein [Clostridium botulinum]
MGLIRHDTVSTKFQKIDDIINLLVTEMDNDQELKRLCTYLTYQPLSDKSTDMSGNVIYQRDIITSMLKEQKICVSKSIDKMNMLYKEMKVPQILVPYCFQEDKILKEQVSLFVHNFRNDLDSQIGANDFVIDVLVPSKYQELKPYGVNRLHEILKRLSYLFDYVETDDESSETLGNITFNVVGRPVEQRINKTNEITIYSVIVRTKLINARGNDYDTLKFR